MESELRFIYANDIKTKLLRHLSFWSLWFLFQLLLYSFTPSALLQQQTFLNRLMISWPETLIFMLPGLFLAYTLMYVVIPWLIIPGRYFWTAISVAILILFTGLFSAFLSVTVVDFVRHRMLMAMSATVPVERHPPLYVQLGVAVLAGLRGSITIGGIAAAIKLMKCFYEKQQAALRSEKEKVQAELQTLKAQLHPHFLFNTLNNIHSFILSHPQRASVMILQLSQLLRYVLYECNSPLVPLDKELKMLNEYILLEKVRYDSRLELSLALPETAPGRNIAPLILLPFVENAFKHGASRIVELPWIRLSIQIQNNWLIMKIVNAKPPVNSKDTNGIGITNARMRLDLLYSNRYELHIQEEEEMYIVNLKMDLAAT